MTIGKDSSRHAESTREVNHQAASEVEEIPLPHSLGTRDLGGRHRSPQTSNLVDQTLYLDAQDLCLHFFAIAWNVRSATLDT
jgi:hypothetical protein